MSKISFQISYPAIIESIVVFFLLRYRKKRYGFAFRRIKLTKGKFAIVDPDDYQKLSRYDWQLFESKGKSYAAMFDDGKIVYMHRFIINAPCGRIVDHHNRESLDNRKVNLRFATHSQNCCNKKILKKGTSEYRGVSLIKKSNKWQAVIYYNGTRKHLGLFENQQDAARAYDNAAKKYHGEFAMLNFPDESPVQII